MTIKRRLVFIRPALIALLGLLSACGAAEMNDLKQFVKDKSERPGGLIEPIPTFTAYEAFVYSASGMRSPFDRPVEVVELTSLRLRSSVAPDRTRPKEFLEQFSVDSLLLVGRLDRQNTQWALLRDPRGGIHRVREGSYVGPDHGKVVDIGTDYVAILEIVTDGTSNGWVERPRTLELSSQ